VVLQTHVPENFRLCRGGDERTVKAAQTVSEDPHWRERKFWHNSHLEPNKFPVRLMGVLALCVCSESNVLAIGIIFCDDVALERRNKLVFSISI
jgi:hypothetical protein